jgi:transcriptional regulator GlxA family with amidase domain
MSVVHVCNSRSCFTIGIFVKQPWDVKIIGDKPEHTSTSGLKIPMHGNLLEAKSSDVVLFASGPGTRTKYGDTEYLNCFDLNPERQMIGSMCSGALILAGLGLLKNKEATTYPTAKSLLESLGVSVVEKPFVQNGNIATAAGCLAAQYLIGWVIETKVGIEMRKTVLKSIQPVGEGLNFTDTSIVEQMYSPK